MSLALGSALELLLSPAAKLVVASYPIQSTFHRKSQSDQFVDRFVVVAQNKEKMTFHNDGFFFPLVSS